MTEAFQAKLAKAVMFEPMDAISVLTRLHAAFPIPEGDEETHSLTLTKEGELEIIVWTDGDFYSAKLKRVPLANWTAGEISETEKRLMAKLPQPEGGTNAGAAPET